MNDIRGWFRQRARVDAHAIVGGRRARCRLAARHRARPEVLFLEDRRLMASFVVTNPTDALTDGVPTPNTLRWAVNQADLATEPSDPSVIEFSLGGGPTTITLTQGPLVLNNAAVPVSIMGPGSQSLAVSGDDAGRIFDVDARVQATISGVELEDGRSSFGGAINNHGNLTVLDCQLVGNTAPPFNYYDPQTRTGVSGPGSGGAIYNSGTLSLANCTLTGNSATFGGAISESVFSGGAISLTLKDCTLSGNSVVPIPAFFGAEGAGGAIASEAIGGQSTISLTGCTLSNNFGAPDGGAINAGTYSNGSTTLSLLNCTLSGNSSTGNGGAVASYGNTLMLTGCTLAGNTAGGSGGGAYITGTDTMTGCTLTGNAAAGSGGGAYITGTGTLTGCTLTGNSAGGSGGGGIHDQGSLELTGCTVNDNSAGSAGGGGIENSAGSLAMTDCTVSGNIAASGGGISTYGYLIVHRGFGYYGQYNLPITEPGTASATLTGCTISGNSATGAGGAVLNITGAVVMTNCTVSGNTGTSGGGIVNRAYYDNDQVRYLPYGVAYGVTVTEPGAASLALSACTIVGNSASQGVGGIDNEFLQPGSVSARATLTDTIVAGNVGAEGKADDIDGNDSAGVTGSYNLIGTGGSGGLTAAGHNLLNIANPGLAPLGDYGGPTETMALQPSSPARHAGTPVAGVSADQRGFSPDSPRDIGAFQSQSGPLVVDTAIDALGSPPGQLSLRQAVNLADILQGGATITFGKSAFSGPTVISLTAGQLDLSNPTGPVSILGPGLGSLVIKGGGTSRIFQVDKGVSAFLSGLTIEGGVTSGDGGGLLNLGSATLSADAVVGNSAADGGGIANSGTAVILGSTIDGDAASADGGGIFNTGELTLVRSDLSASSAGTDGGGLYNSGVAVLFYSTVDDNSASAGGGAYADASGGLVALTGTQVKGNKGGDIFGQVISQ